MTEAIKVNEVSKVFGVVKALDHVSLSFREHTIHALMGENGAGKSTIAKCIMGFYQADEGMIEVFGERKVITNPKEAHQLGIGMVYQHFMLVENMTVAENFLLSRDSIPWLINWTKELKDLERFMETMPFKLNLKAYVSELSAGEKQKLEILKMLFLHCKILILDEPTSVLTPGEADEVLMFIRQLVDERKLTVLIITHKFREVFGFADEVSVLRKGKYIGHGKVKDLSRSDIAEMMIGTALTERRAERVTIEIDELKLKIDGLYDSEMEGVAILNHLSLTLNKGEIYGIAGVSGNGQKRLVEILSGQKVATSGKIFVDGEEYSPKRKWMKKYKFYCLPEEPLKNACIPDMSVAENMALRYFDEAPYTKRSVILNKRITENARMLIEKFKVKTPYPTTPIRALSGGNVQRAVLARELSGDVEVLVISNPCFGLDFNAIAEIRSAIIHARNNGAAVLLLSEDLEEILELSDKVGVIFNGKIIYEVSQQDADLKIIGEKMAGQH